MTILDKCPLCNSKNVVPYNQKGAAPVVEHEIMPKVFLKAQIITQYFVCASCKVIFQNPRMTDKELDNFYKNGVYRKIINLTDEEKDSDERLRAKIDSDIIKKNLNLDAINSHLDIGCSRGFFLTELGVRNKFGVEVDSSNVTEQGIKVFKKITDIKQKFDLITLIHTLEHIPRPKEYLIEIINLISDDGYFVLEVPTWKSPGGPLRLSHLFHFEPDVLRLLLKELGLKIVQTEFTPHFFLICQKTT